MIKYGFTFVLVGLLFSCNMKLDDENSRKEFVNSCVDEFKALSNGSVADTLVTSYCNCTADKMLANFDMIDLIRLNDTTTQVYKESQELIKPCLELLD